MKTKHTKGKWTYNPAFARFEVNVKGNKRNIAEVYGGTQDEAKANAKLIAAAPELLEALVLALSRVDAEYERTESDYVKQILDKGNKAIKKATS